MADAHGSGPCVRKDVGVQLPPCPPQRPRKRWPAAPKIATLPTVLLTIPLSALAQRLSLIGFVLVEQTELGVLVQKSRWDAPFAVGLALLGQLPIGDVDLGREDHFEDFVAYGARVHIER